MFQPQQRAVELAHQIYAFRTDPLSEGVRWIDEFDTLTLRLVRYVVHQYPYEPPPNREHYFPPSWQVDRSVINAETRDFLRLVDVLQYQHEFNEWLSLQSPWERTTPFQPLGRPRRRNRSTSNSTTHSRSNSDASARTVNATEPLPALPSTPPARAAGDPTTPEPPHFRTPTMPPGRQLTFQQEPSASSSSSHDGNASTERPSTPVTLSRAELDDMIEAAVNRAARRTRDEL
jgi:hypothetical protein